MKPILLLLRHGETELNANDQFRGWLNISLNDTGRKQAADAAEFLKKYPVSMVIHSPLDRATETAHILGHQTSQPDGRLMPWNLGVLAGKDKKPFGPLRDFYLDHPDVQVPGGESVSEFENRFGPALEMGLKHGLKGGLPLFVTHTSNVAAAQGLLSGVRGRLEEMDAVKPGGIAAVVPNGNKFEVRALFRGTSEPLGS